MPPRPQNCTLPNAAARMENVCSATARTALPSGSANGSWTHRRHPRRQRHPLPASPIRRPAGTARAAGRPRASTSASPIAAARRAVPGISTAPAALAPAAASSARRSSRRASRGPRLAAKSTVPRHFCAAAVSWTSVRGPTRRRPDAIPVADASQVGAPAGPIPDAGPAVTHASRTRPGRLPARVAPLIQRPATPVPWACGNSR